MGLSKYFKDYVTAKQDEMDKQGGLKAMQLFASPEEQQRFEPILKDVLLNIFDDPSERRIFLAGLQGMKQNYPDIFDPAKSRMACFPETFSFDERIKKNNTVVVSALEEMTKEMKETDSDFKKIKKYLLALKPQVAESNVFDPLLRYFYNKRGIFLHSLKLEQYLKIFSDLAKQSRKQHKNTPQMTNLEEKLKDAFDITEDTLDEKADIVIASLTQSGNQGPFTAEDIHSEIDKCFSKNKSNAFKQKAKQMFKRGSIYTKDDAKSYLRLAKLYLEINPAGENDLMMILPDLQLFISLEIKSHNKENQANAAQGTGNVPATGSGSNKMSNSGIDNNLIGAAKQLNKNCKYIAQLHGSILNKGWGFLKCAAVLPGLIKSNGICEHCKRFLLTEEELLEPGGIDKWFQKMGLEQFLGKIDKQRSQQDFLILFNRLVNLSCIGLQPTSQPMTWEQVEGANTQYLSAGFTSGPKGSKVTELSFNEAQSRPVDFLKALYYNRKQYRLLTTEDILRVVFFSDYGAGKK